MAEPSAPRQRRYSQPPEPSKPGFVMRSSPRENGSSAKTAAGGMRHAIPRPRKSIATTTTGRWGPKCDLVIDDPFGFQGESQKWNEVKRVGPAQRGNFGSRDRTERESKILRATKAGEHILTGIPTGTTYGFSAEPQLRC